MQRGNILERQPCHKPVVNGILNGIQYDGWWP